MEVRITIDDHENTSRVLDIQNDALSEIETEINNYVWLTIKPKDNTDPDPGISVCVLIEELKHALRKITTK